MAVLIMLLTSELRYITYFLGPMINIWSLLKNYVLFTDMANAIPQYVQETS